MFCTLKLILFKQTVHWKQMIDYWKIKIKLFFNELSLFRQKIVANDTKDLSKKINTN